MIGLIRCRDEGDAGLVRKYAIGDRRGVGDGR